MNFEFNDKNNFFNCKNNTNIRNYQINPQLFMFFYDNYIHNNNI